MSDQGPGAGGDQSSRGTHQRARPSETPKTREGFLGLEAELGLHEYSRVREAERTKGARHVL